MEIKIDSFEYFKDTGVKLSRFELPEAPYERWVLAGRQDQEITVIDIEQGPGKNYVNVSWPAKINSSQADLMISKLHELYPDSPVKNSMDGSILYLALPNLAIGVDVDGTMVDPGVNIAFQKDKLPSDQLIFELYLLSANTDTLPDMSPAMVVNLAHGISQLASSLVS